MDADCPACGGLGWQRVDAPVGHKLFGQVFPCELCGQGRRDNWLEAVSRLSPEMRTWELAGFRESPATRGAAAEVQAALQARAGWVVLSGPPGTGKSYLLAAAVNWARRMGLAAVYTTMADLLADLRNSFDPEVGHGYSSLFGAVLAAPVLALDELEKFQGTSWAEEQVFRLFEQRYRIWDRAVTLLATNRRIAPGKQVLDDTRYPGYLESRLQDGRFVRLDFWGAADARPALG